MGQRKPLGSLHPSLPIIPIPYLLQQHEVSLGSGASVRFLLISGGEKRPVKGSFQDWRSCLSGYLGDRVLWISSFCISTFWISAFGSQLLDLKLLDLSLLDLSPLDFSFLDLNFGSQIFGHHPYGSQLLKSWPFESQPLLSHFFGSLLIQPKPRVPSVQLLELLPQGWFLLTHWHLNELLGMVQLGLHLVLFPPQ